MSSTADAAWDAPPVNRSMRALDRDFFVKEVPLIAAEVPDAKKVGELRKLAGTAVIRRSGIEPVASLPSSQTGRRIVFRQDIDEANLEEKLGEDVLAYIRHNDIKIVKHTGKLQYANWTAEQILRSVLPEDLLDETPAGFSMVGHIAHLNLRDQFLPYKQLIGEVILDKNKPGGVRTVVNKLDTIDTKYRTFDMEVLAGESIFDVEQHEQNCRFRFDFRKVYWNSRLHTEHERLCNVFKAGQAVCDVMAGVGPFAIPAAKREVLVYANDLNPESYASLAENVKLNKVSHLCVPSEMDGLVFVKHAVEQLYARRGEEVVLPRVKRSQPERSITIPAFFSHFVMNLPASAIDMLGAYRGAYSGLKIDDTANITMPRVHVHSFTHCEGSAAEEDLAARASASLGYKLTPAEIDYHLVRKVAPSKTMFCCSFTLPLEVAFA
ncbi:tRNA(m(1)G37)methyltransferase [Savitreella phatthalungensis]